VVSHKEIEKLMKRCFWVINVKNK